MEKTKGIIAVNLNRTPMLTARMPKDLVIESLLVEILLVAAKIGSLMKW